MVRWHRFIEIFSGRDARFAVGMENLPGGSLERRIADFLEIDLEDPDWWKDREWSWPIPSDAPETAPVLARLLYLFQSERSDGGLLPIAQALMDLRTEFLPEDYRDGTVVENFAKLLGQTIEVLLGLPEGMLTAVMEPAVSWENLLVRVRMKVLPEAGSTTIELI